MTISRHALRSRHWYLCHRLTEITGFMTLVHGAVPTRRLSSSLIAKQTTYLARVVHDLNAHDTTTASTTSTPATTSTTDRLEKHRDSPVCRSAVLGFLLRLRSHLESPILDLNNE